MFAGFCILILSTILTYVGVALFRRMSLQKEWVDVPNERSSHRTPTPVGGGVVIVTICVLAYISIGLFLGRSLSIGYLAGALTIAIVSWFDDLYSLSFMWRLLAHFGAAVLVVTSTGYWVDFGLPGSFSISLPGLGQLITIVWIVWMINAYNFMDGIDGISGVQGAVAAAAWIIAGVTGFRSEYLYPLTVLGACIGFLVHNWAPAKIFMGDVGSAFLGFSFAAMPIILNGPGEPTGIVPFVTLLFVWPFFFDTVVTLLSRLVRGEKIWQAHRSHLYQRLAIAGYSHAAVSTLYGIFALCTAAVGLYVLSAEGSLLVWLFPAVILISIIFAFCVRTLTKRTSLGQ